MHRLCRFLALLAVLGLLAIATRAAEESQSSPPPVTPDLRQYAFELQTLNARDRVRRGRAGQSIEFNIDSAMSDDELESVSNILDELQAAQPDAEGYRSLSLSNGTRVRIGGFVQDSEVAGAGVQSLPVEFSVKGEFSTSEAALVLQLVAGGNLLVASSVDPERVATPAEIADRDFRKRHKLAGVTPDEATLAEWIRQNIDAR